MILVEVSRDGELQRSKQTDDIKEAIKYFERQAGRPGESALLEELLAGVQAIEHLNQSTGELVSAYELVEAVV